MCLRMVLVFDCTLDLQLKLAKCGLKACGGPKEASKLLCNNAENAKTIRQKGLRPPAGTPRPDICVFYWQGQHKTGLMLHKPKQN